VSLWLIAEPLELRFDTQQRYSTLAHTSYIKDCDGQYRAEDIVAKEDLVPLLKSSFGYLKCPLWLTFSISNPTAKPLHVNFIHSRNSTERIELSAFSNLTPSKETWHLGTLVAPQPTELSPYYNAVQLFFAPHERKEIAIRLDSSGVLHGTWHVMSDKGLSTFIANQMLIRGFFIGVICIIILYNLTIFAILRWTPFIFCSLYAFFFAYQQLGSSKILYGWFGEHVDLMWLRVSEYGAGILAVIAILLFHRTFLETKKHFSLWFNVLLYWVPLLSLLAILLLGVFDKAFLPHIIGSLVNYMFILYGLLIVVGMAGIYKKINGAFLYTLAQSSLFIAFLLQLFGGYTNAVIVGFTLDILFLSMALALRIRHMQKEVAQTKKMLIVNSRLASSGQIISNVMHEWKVPLVRLGSLITECEMHLHLHRQALAEHIENLLPMVKKNIAYMKNTVTEFQQFYQKDLKKTLFNPHHEIQTILMLLEGKRLALNASIEVSSEPSFEGKEIMGYPHSFAHLVMIIVDNALNIAEQRHVTAVRIHISLTELNSQCILQIEDNGGGIKQRPIESIFDPFEQHSAEHGLGLCIVKTIVDMRLSGSINVKNTFEGACFTITFPMT
jgi:signal transduction histidine kinase